MQDLTLWVTLGAAFELAPQNEWLPLLNLVGKEEFICDRIAGDWSACDV